MINTLKYGNSLINLQCGRLIKRGNITELSDAARCLTLSGAIFSIDKGDLIIDDKESIAIGEIIKYSYTEHDFKYDTNFIATSFSVSKDSKRAQVNEIAINNTTTFMLPAIHFSPAKLNFDWYMTNAFIEAKNKHIVVQYRWLPFDCYRTFASNLKNVEGYIGYKKDQRDSRMDLVTFKLQEEHLKDLDLFLKGKYSKLSDKLKKAILRFHNSKKGDPLYGILYRDNEHVERLAKKIGVPISNIPDELHSKINKEDEMIEL